MVGKHKVRTIEANSEEQVKTQTGSPAQEARREETIKIMLETRTQRTVRVRFLVLHSPPQALHPGSIYSMETLTFNYLVTCSTVVRCHRAARRLRVRSPGPRLFWVEFACSLCVRVGSLLPTAQRHAHYAQSQTTNRCGR